MTSRDKTGDKLVASIRKTKAGSTQTATTSSTTPAKPRRAASTAKAQPKATPKAKSASPVKRRPSAAKKSAGSYQSTGRVWPD